MQALVPTTARFTRAVVQVYAEKWNFLALFVLIFAFSIFILARLDLLPDTPAPVTAIPAAAVAFAPVAVSDGVEQPAHIEIPAIGLTATVANPSTTNTVALDALLLKGAVRYPTSAELGETGNVVLFGHSSYLPIVGNQAYKTFDGIQKLTSGDLITVSSTSTAYIYTVTSVSKESANDAGISLVTTGKELTLVTCNSFATKSDRFVVVADFVGSHSLPQ